MIITVFLVKLIGFKTQGEETLNICYLGSLAQYINTTLLVLFSSANLDGTPLEVINFMGIKGTHNHMSTEWYKDVGNQLVMTQ